MAPLAQIYPLPIAVFFDGIDALTDESLEAVFCGLCNMHDYKVAAGGSTTLGTAGPFIVKTESITFASFNLKDVSFLYL